MTVILNGERQAITSMKRHIGGTVNGATFEKNWLEDGERVGGGREQFVKKMLT